MTGVSTPYPEAAKTLLRNTLIGAARDELQRRAWSEITMADIATAAGVSRQTFYKEFGSRDEFAQAFVIHEGERFLDGVEAAVREHLDDPRAAVGAALEAFLRSAGEDPLVRVLLSDDGTGGMLPFVTTQGMPVVAVGDCPPHRGDRGGLAAGARRPRPTSSPRPSSASRSATSPPRSTRPRPPPPAPASCSAPSSTRRWARPLEEGGDQIGEPLGLLCHEGVPAALEALDPAGGPVGGQPVGVLGRDDDVLGAAGGEDPGRAGGRLGLLFGVPGGNRRLLCVEPRQRRRSPGCRGRSPRTTAPAPRETAGPSPLRRPNSR